MKNSFYFLTAVGPDRPGLVAKVTGVLAQHGCNLEDSSMMRLGSEFGMFVIFTSHKPLPLEKIKKERAFRTLFVDLKPISSKNASFTKPSREPWIVRVHGADKTGLVFGVTKCLADHGFNITDLSTHRTSAGRVPGYALFIEGEPVPSSMKKLGAALKKLATKLETHISFEPVVSATL